MPKPLTYFCLLALLVASQKTAGDIRPRKIVLIAGKKSHGPGEHEYPKSVRLLKVLLDRSPNLGGIKTEAYFNGWPEDPSVLDTADTIVMLSDGMEWLPYIDSDDRLHAMQKQMDRGCGFLALHFTTYVPDKYGHQALEWDGGYFDYDGDSAYRSEQKTLETDVVLAAAEHPISRGVTAYHYKDEFYYKMHFDLGHGNLTPIVRVPALSLIPQEQTVAWAYLRKNGGRSVGITYGHYYDNWQRDDYRKLILNAIVWTAGVNVPSEGVQSAYVKDEEVEDTLAPVKK
jgi:type 1 glutamine amidotransferase